MDQLDENEKSLSILKQQLEIEKLQKEVARIDYETAEIYKKWYKKPQWIAALSPVLIGILTLTVAWASGFLQAQSTLNKIQQETYNSRQDSIDRVIKSSRLIRDSLIKYNSELVERNTISDSINKKMKEYSNVLYDSLKTASEKKKYFSDQFLSLQRENIKLKILNNTLTSRRTINLPNIPIETIAKLIINGSGGEIRNYIELHDTTGEKIFFVDFDKKKPH
jgi:hypothetical protein